MTWEEIEGLDFDKDFEQLALENNIDLNRFDEDGNPVEMSLEEKQDIFNAIIAKLKKQNLRDRLESIKDLRWAVYKSNIEAPNLEVYKNQLIDTFSHDIISQLVVMDTNTQIELATEKVIEDLISEGENAIRLGNKVVALINALNSKKNLEPSQIQTIVNIYSPIISLLQTGSLKTAKVLIGNIEPDGVVMVQSDKDMAMSLLDKILGE